MKVAIIQAIDRKVALDDIALSKGIEFEMCIRDRNNVIFASDLLRKVKDVEVQGMEG